MNKRLTLLEKFIYDKKSKYKEPSKKGIPRGEKVGFSKQKYDASLELMKEVSLVELAKSENISYSVVRIWNREPEFEVQIAQNCKEFALIVVAHLKETIMNSFERYFEFWSGRIDEEPVIERTYPEFEDAAIYSKQLKENIRKQSEEFDKLRENYSNPDDRLIFSLVTKIIHDEILYPSGTWDNFQFISKEAKNDEIDRLVMMNDLLKHSMQVLEKDRISAPEKRQLLTIQGIFSDFLHDLMTSAKHREWREEKALGRKRTAER